MRKGPHAQWPQQSTVEEAGTQRDEMTLPRPHGLSPVLIHLLLPVLQIGVTKIIESKERALSIPPGKAMFLWKWAADDVTLPYPITRYSANLCTKLVLVKLEPGEANESILLSHC